MRRFLAVLLIVLPSLGAADPFDALRQPGAFAIMRHALAPGTGDPAGFALDDCATQRNLDARGRDQARRIGAALRAADIAFDAVWSSQWCRCMDTARLIDMGEVTAEPRLNSFFQGRGDGPAQTAALRERLQERPEGARVLLVTHQVNITALIGVYPASGEVIVARLDRAGDIEVLGRIETAP